MLGRLCPKCRRIIPAGQRYCAPCQRAVDEYQERRRAEQKTIATEVHHLKAIQTPEGWERRFDMDNLICVCGKCHNKLHGRFGGRG